MPVIVNESQFLRKGVTYPRGVYSRVVGVVANYQPPPFVNVCAYSPIIGNRFWLLRVKLWFKCWHPTTSEVAFAYIRIGTGIPNVGSLLYDWNEVIPLYGGAIKPAQSVYGNSLQLDWDMNQLYDGDSLRFGLLLDAGVSEDYSRLYVWFQISEG